MKKYNVIFSDLDGTLIETVSGETFPKGIWDMQIRFEVLDKIKEVLYQSLFMANTKGVDSIYQAKVILTAIAMENAYYFLQKNKEIGVNLPLLGTKIRTKSLTQIR